MARDRASLRARTLGDPRFVEAMALSNPTVAEKMRALGDDSGKRTRHLETTLYRHLARAAGRATPCDVW